MSQRQDELQFAIVLAQNVKGANSSQIAELADTLIRQATRLHKRYEEACNEEWANTDEYTEKTRRIEDKVRELLASCGIAIKFEHDPRAMPVKLTLPSGQSNDAGGEGFFCVPTRD